jgi:GNAT superfamily N-acetyltransferase
MTIRPATIDDAMDIATVHVASWKAAYQGQLPQDYLDNLKATDRLNGWEGVLRETSWPMQGVLVLTAAAPDEAAIRGFAHICPTRDEDLDQQTVGEITSIYLSPDAFGSGNGVALMGACLDLLEQAGYQTASLWALDTNARARRFYQIGGWREDGATKLHDWGQFVCTDIRYLKTLG